MNRRIPHLSVTLAMAALVVWACSSTPTTPTPVPTTVTVTPTPVTLNAFGATQQLTATVRDQNGNAMSGQTVTWSSSATSVASVTANPILTRPPSRLALGFCANVTGADVPGRGDASDPMTQA